MQVYLLSLVSSPKLLLECKAFLTEEEMYGSPQSHKIRSELLFTVWSDLIFLNLKNKERVATIKKFLSAQRYACAQKKRKRKKKDKAQSLIFKNLHRRPPPEKVVNILWKVSVEADPANIGKEIAIGNKSRFCQGFGV